MFFEGPLEIARFSQTDKYITGFINAQMLIIRLFDLDLCDYFSQYLKNRFFQEIVVKKTTGSAVRQMPANVVAEFLVPLPPLPEQHRIVARIDKLMALCDTLEQQIDAATGKQTELLGAVMRFCANAGANDYSLLPNTVTAGMGI